MDATIWLKIEGKKWRGFASKWELGKVSVSKSKPATDEHEIAVKLSLEIPDAVFEEPVFEVKLKMPDTTRRVPDWSEISSDVAGALTKRLGFKVKLEVPQPEEVTE
jgi:hypothetical protein